MASPNPVRVIVFDVNETLSDLAPLGGRLEDIGLPAAALPAWFAAVLRDGFALTAAGGYADFAQVAAENVQVLLAGTPQWRGDAPAAARHVIEGFAALTVHQDVPDGVRELRAAGYRLQTMTNGSAATTRALLEGAGLLEHFEALLDVSGPRCWKPAAAAYHHATDRAGVRPEEALLVAVHPWDVDGARRAGLAGAWLRRGTAHYPAVMTPPDRQAPSLPDLARALGPAPR